MGKIILVMLALSLVAGSCKKDKTGICVKGKMIRITCASMVIQVLNNNSIGMDNWEDRISASRNTYDNVISVRNKCEVPASLAAGDEFWFTPGSSHSSVCIFCDMLDFPPSVSYDIQNVSLTACSN